MKSKTALLLCFILFLSSCGKDEEHEYVEDKNYLSNLERSKEASISRERLLKKMDQAKSLDLKAAYASVYFQLFEFQLWSNQASRGDSLDYREILKAQAVLEFFTVLKEKVTKLNGKKLKVTSDSSHTLNIYALAISLHQISNYQSEITKNENFKKITMLSLIERALKQKKFLMNRSIEIEDLTTTEKIVLQFENEAYMILNARYNIYPSMVLANVSKLKKKFPLYYLGVPSLFKKIRHLFFNWNSLYPNLNPVIQVTMNQYLEEALRVKEVMNSIGFRPILNKKVKKSFKNMSMYETSCKNCNYENEEHINRFMDNIDKLIGLSLNKK